jgi:predicted O-methyltransferase YrrM
MQDLWTSVDQYIVDHLVGADRALTAALESSHEAGLPAIAVAPNQGKFLHLLARIHGARRILEIGTLGGYSTIWLARAVPGDGRVITLEIDPAHAEVARKNIAGAGFADRVDVWVGPASASLERLIAERAPPFDLIFIDADKASSDVYFTAALRLSRVGTIIIVDNVVRDGKVIDAGSDDAGIQGIRRLNELLARETRVDATAIQTVGSKGYDGFAMAVVTSGLDA